MIQLLHPDRVNVYERLRRDGISQVYAHSSSSPCGNALMTSLGGCLHLSVIRQSLWAPTELSLPWINDGPRASLTAYVM